MSNFDDLPEPTGAPVNDDYLDMLPPPAAHTEIVQQPSPSPLKRGSLKLPGVRRPSWRIVLLMLLGLALLLFLLTRAFSTNEDVPQGETPAAAEQAPATTPTSEPPAATEPEVVEESDGFETTEPVQAIPDAEVSANLARFFATRMADPADCAEYVIDDDPFTQELGFSWLCTWADSDFADGVFHVSLDSPILDDNSAWAIFGTIPCGADSQQVNAVEVSNGSQTVRAARRDVPAHRDTCPANNLTSMDAIMERLGL